MFAVDLSRISFFHWWFFTKANGNQWILIFSLGFENYQYFDETFLPITAVRFFI